MYILMFSEKNEHRLCADDDPLIMAVSMVVGIYPLLQLNGDQMRIEHD